MPVFKITNCERTKKKSIMGGSLEEVTEKGIKKLDLNVLVDCVTVVLDECGTDIEDDEVLVEFASMSKVFMLLKKDEDVPEEDRYAVAKTKDEEAPIMFVFISSVDETMEDIMIAGDGVRIYSQADTVLDGLFVLIALYYVFHLQYPRAYAQFLGLLQEYVILETYKGMRSKKFKLLTKDLNRLLHQ